MNNIPLIGNNQLLSGVISTGLGNRPGTSGTYNLLYSATTDNYRIERISVIPGGPIGTVGGYAVRLYVSNNGGTTLRLFRESIITSSDITLRAAPPYQAQFFFPGGLCVNSGTSLWVGQSVAATGGAVSNWVIEGTSFSGGSPIFPATPRLENFLINSASTRNDTNTLFKIFTAGLNGSRIERIIITPNNNVGVASNNKLVWLFVKTPSGSIVQYKENTLRAITPTALSTIAGNDTYFNFLSGGLILRPNQELYGGISTYSGTQDTVIYNIEGKDF